MKIPHQSAAGKQDRHTAKGKTKIDLQARPSGVSASTQRGAHTATQMLLRQSLRWRQPANFRQQQVTAQEMVKRDESL